MKRWIILGALALGAAIAIAGDRWDVSKAGREQLVAATDFVNHVPAATDNVTTGAGSTILYLGKADPETTQAIFVGPWRRVGFLLRMDGSNTETDDSVDVLVRIDGSYDNVTWTQRDSITITDTLWKFDQVDSALGMYQGMYIRIRPDPITGMRQDTVGVRPNLAATVIYR